jgi:DeoR family transcriptional regulator, suf operon transcriptional repressor
MLDLLGRTQQKLLRLLHKNKQGLTIYELVEKLSVSRTAIKQHLISLAKTKLIKEGNLHKSGGRPTQSYVLTPYGEEQFPRQYSWFAQMLLESIKSEQDGKGLESFLKKLGSSISLKYTETLTQLPIKKRIQEVTNILSGLGYEAKVTPTSDKNEISKIEISNCIFHQLANACPEVCSFDKSLLANLSGKQVELQSCITLGSDVCCFGIKK